MYNLSGVLNGSYVAVVSTELNSNQFCEDFEHVSWAQCCINCGYTAFGWLQI